MLFPGDPVDVAAYLNGVTIKGKPVETIRLGPGLSTGLNHDTVVCKSAGDIIYKPPNKFWLKTPNHVRYIPRLGDLVIGRVVTKTGDYLKVDIGTPHPAILNFDGGFEAATRRNRPNLVVGSLLLGRVTQASRYREAELVCVDANGKAGGLGEIPKSIMVFKLPIPQCWELQRPDCPLLTLLGKHLSFEIVIGANGWFGIDSEDVSLTLAIRDAIQSGAIDEDQVKQLAKQFKKQQ